MQGILELEILRGEIKLVEKQKDNAVYDDAHLIGSTRVCDWEEHVNVVGE